jgi:hypothetical protein
MNLQPIPIDNILLGKPLPWRIYDRNGYLVFSEGEIATSRAQLEDLQTGGFFQDIDATATNRETTDWDEFSSIAPSEIFPPQGIKPQIGEFVQIVLPNRNPQNYYSARLIGCVKDLSILVTRPAETPFIPVEGETVEVRMVTGKNIYTFQTVIQRLCISPTQYLHLDYPIEVRSQKLRKSPWAKMNIAVITTDAKGNREFAQLVNLSSDGGQLHAPASLGESGDTLKVSLPAVVDNLNATLELEATILHARVPSIWQAEEAGIREFGVSFNNLTPGDALWLKALVYRHLAEGDSA